MTKTRRNGTGGVVQRRVAAFSRGRDQRGMLAEAARQARIRETRFVRACLSAKPEAFGGKDGVCEIDER